MPVPVAWRDGTSAGEPTTTPTHEGDVFVLLKQRTTTAKDNHNSIVAKSKSHFNHAISGTPATLLPSACWPALLQAKAIHRRRSLRSWISNFHPKSFPHANNAT